MITSTVAVPGTAGPLPSGPEKFGPGLEPSGASSGGVMLKLLEPPMTSMVE